jgi:acyl carrier protein
MNSQEISAFCVDQLAEILRVPKDTIDTNANFARLGLDSAMSVYLLMELEEKFNLELDYDMLAEYPTIERLSACLADKLAEAQTAVR